MLIALLAHLLPKSPGQAGQKQPRYREGRYMGGVS